MMMTPRILRSHHFRIWLNQLPENAVYEGIAHLEHNTTAEPSTITGSRKAAVLFKAWEQRYGLLGAEFIPSTSGQLVIRVSISQPYSAGSNYGLEDDFADLVFGQLAIAAEVQKDELMRLGAGVLQIACATVHPVDSSELTFYFLTSYVVRLLAPEVDAMLGEQVVRYMKAAQPLSDFVAARPAVMPRLLGIVNHTNAGVRKQAVDLIGTLGSNQGTPVLCQVLNDGVEHVRQAAVWALGKTRDGGSSPALIKALEEQLAGESSEKRFEMNYATSLVKALGDIGALPAVPVLISILGDRSSDSLRRSAAEALGAIGSNEAVPALINALGDDSYWVRAQSAEALGQIGDPQAFQPLVRALKDKHDFVRSSAVRSLGELKRPSAIPLILNAMQNQSTFVLRAVPNALSNFDPAIVTPQLLNLAKSRRTKIRACSMATLGKLKSEQGIAVLIQGLNDRALDVRLAAVKGLEESGDVRSIPPLLNALQNRSRKLRLAVLKALAQIGDTSIVPELLSALKKNPDEVCEEVFRALAQVGDTVAVPGLLKLVTNSKTKPFKLAYAMWALGEIGAQQAVPALIARLGDEREAVYGRWQVGKWAADALAAIETPEALAAASKWYQQHYGPEYVA